MTDLIAHVATCSQGCRQIHDSVHVICAEGLRLLNVGSFNVRLLERLLETGEVSRPDPFMVTDPSPICDWRNGIDP